MGEFEFLGGMYEKVGGEVVFNKVVMRGGRVRRVGDGKDMVVFGV